METKAAARLVLQESLVRRIPTFKVAQSILELQVVSKPVSPALFSALTKLAANQMWVSEMYDDFDRVDAADTQLETFKKLFPTINTDRVDASDPKDLTYLIRSALEYLGVLDTTAAEAISRRLDIHWVAGHTTSRKAFVKRLRFLKNFEEKISRMSNTLQLRHAQMQAKSRLAYSIQVEKLDDLSLAFAAYLTARSNRRSLFSLGGQSKAFDDISDGLQELLTDDSAWDQIALIMPTPKVFKKLDPETCGNLVGIFHKEMVIAAQSLERIYPSLPERMRDEMVMVKGVDSSSWNAYAGALNTMRSAWIAATVASGLEEMFDSYLPGKAPRLMAADVVWWARSSGQELHEDTRMFTALPNPWEVVSGVKTQTRGDILAVAKVLKVDAEKTGWVGPRSDVVSEVASAEPATVHGVIVSDPQLAVTLRRCGVFSGQKLRDLEVIPQDVYRADEVTADGRTLASAELV